MDNETLQALIDAIRENTNELRMQNELLKIQLKTAGITQQQSVNEEAFIEEETLKSTL